MGQTCSAGYYKAWDNPYASGQGHQGGANTGDPRFSGHGSSAGGGGMAGSNKCVAVPQESPNKSQIQGNPSTGLGSSNVFDTSANRLQYISPIHT